jgi:hypothetical protein
MFKQISILLFLFVLSFPAMLFAQNLDAGKKKEKITVKETMFDFGKIMQGKPVFHDFQGALSMKGLPLCRARRIHTRPQRA